MNGVVDIDIFYAFWLLNYLFRHENVTCGIVGFIVIIVFCYFKKPFVLYLDFQ